MKLIYNAFISTENSSSKSSMSEVSLSADSSFNIVEGDWNSESVLILMAFWVSISAEMRWKESISDANADYDSNNMYNMLNEPIVM